ncbi:MAG: hypothetical protein H6502_04590 [Candidatus Woesearchaeota archaeon]|nr:MAG: hypothetical protein H6502_04590 [Candidatus Woesearchaeota archaeon]
MKPLSQKTKWAAFGIPSVVFIGGLFALSYQITQTNERETLQALGESDARIRAVVLSEDYKNKLSSVPERYISGFVSQAYSNETVKLDSPLTTRVEILDGAGVLPPGLEFGLSIIDGGSIKTDALELLIHPADEVGRADATVLSFPVGNVVGSCQAFCSTILRYDKNETYIGNTSQVATKRADRIRLE